MRIHNLPVLLAAFTALATSSFSCPCELIPSPCQAVGRSQTAFLGTALRNIHQDNRILTTVRIDRVFQGQLPVEINFITELLPGKQYLIYATSGPSSFTPTFCEPALDIAAAREHLDFLHIFSQGRSPTTVTGAVEHDRSDHPMRGVRLTLHSNTRNFETVTAADGRYAFQDIPPGGYVLRAEQPGFALLGGGYRLSVSSGACTTARLAMAIDRRIHGTVRSSTGIPVKGARIVLALPARNGALRIHSEDRTDAEGNYDFPALDSGEYYLGFNLNVTPIPSSPHIPTFYPGVRHRRDAVPIFVPDAATHLRYDLTEPERLPVVTVRGKAVGAGGTPPPGETGISLTGEDGHESIAIAIRPKADGSFQFQYCKGLRFFINAYAYHDPTETVHTTETQSAVAAGETELLLILTEPQRPAPGATERVSNPTTP
ncbi:MAG: carboxypeptidase regulatory-like domain-containing protein [Bryobacterales bacterium]|nr:carboxypeptidase regulatory-like domain-containing protein [Bryobacterales bacterium]